MVLFVFKMRVLFCCNEKEYCIKAVSSEKVYVKFIVLQETLTQDTRLKLVSWLIKSEFRR
jgi:hypothetical protein